MKISLALASVVALAWITAPSDQAMERCAERHSFATCFHALNR